MTHKAFSDMLTQQLDQKITAIEANIEAFRTSASSSTSTAGADPAAVIAEFVQIKLVITTVGEQLASHIGRMGKVETAISELQTWASTLPATTSSSAPAPEPAPATAPAPPTRASTAGFAGAAQNPWEDASSWRALVPNPLRLRRSVRISCFFCDFPRCSLRLVSRRPPALRL